MYAALGATNEAILRNSDQDALFQRVCEAAVHGGGLKSAAALLPESDHWLRIVAVSEMALESRFRTCAFQLIPLRNVARVLRAAPSGAG